MMVNLTAPCGFSINDNIIVYLYSLEYTSIKQAAKLVKTAGRGVLIGKLDLQAAYMRVLVHALGYHMLGVEWQGVTYYDKTLPFYLHTAPSYSQQ